MENKITLITGANTGIGFATALGLAELGATVVLAARKAERGEPARAEVARLSGNANVHLLLADFGVLAAVRDLAAGFHAQFGRLDVLVNNAAIIPQRREESADGYELQFAVNHLAPFLLTNLLLPALRASTAGRVVSVSSQVHSNGRVDFEDLQAQRGYRPTQVYANTKLMNVLFNNELARRLAGTGITANSLHPGVINTQLYQAYMGRETLPDDLADWRRGAATSLYLATSPMMAGVSGRYFRDEREARPAAVAEDVELAQRLWQVSAKLTGLEEG